MSHVFSGENIRSKLNTPPTLFSQPIYQLVNLTVGDIFTLELSADNGINWTGVQMSLLSNIGTFTVENLVATLNSPGILPSAAVGGLEFFVADNSNLKPVAGSAVPVPLDGPRIMGVRSVTYTGPKILLRVKNNAGQNTAASKLGFVLNQTERGTEGFPYLAILPNPGDPFTALSVNNYQQMLQNRALNQYSFTRKNISKTAKIVADSQDGSTIQMNPLSTIVKFNSQFTRVDSPAKKFTALDIEGGGGFVASTWYYTYLYRVLVFGIPTIFYQLSTTAPDVYNLTKTGDPLKKYLFSFSTDAAGLIIPFHRDGFRTKYYQPYNVLTNGSNLVASPVSCTAVIPPAARLADIHISLTSSGMGSQDFFLSTSAISGGLLGSYTTRQNRELFVRYPTDATQTLYYHVDDANLVMSMDINGFIE